MSHLHPDCVDSPDTVLQMILIFNYMLALQVDRGPGAVAALQMSEATEADADRWGHREGERALRAQWSRSAAGAVVRPRRMGAAGGDKALRQVAHSSDRSERSANLEGSG